MVDTSIEYDVADTMHNIFDTNTECWTLSTAYKTLSIRCNLLNANTH